jgi:hypothetical protein
MKMTEMRAIVMPKPLRYLHQNWVSRLSTSIITSWTNSKSMSIKISFVLNFTYSRQIGQQLRSSKGFVTARMNKNTRSFPCQYSYLPKGNGGHIYQHIPCKAHNVCILVFESPRNLGTNSMPQMYQATQQSPISYLFLGIQDLFAKQWTTRPSLPRTKSGSFSTWSCWLPCTSLVFGC